MYERKMYVCMFICICKENVCSYAKKMYVCSYAKKKMYVCSYAKKMYVCMSPITSTWGGVDRYTPSPIYRATNSLGHPNPRKKALSISYPLSALPRANPDQTLESTQNRDWDVIGSIIFLFIENSGNSSTWGGTSINPLSRPPQTLEALSRPPQTVEASRPLIWSLVYVCH